MTSRVINPRSGSGLYVDLITNQSIAGIKRFLNNFITNADVNFNTTANVGRIVFNPNEPFGSGSQIVSIYTEDEVDGQGWIFDSAGNLYYIGTGISPIKISFAPTGNITSLGNLECQGITANSIVNTFSDINLYNIGSKRFIFKPSASSTNPILSIFTVSDVDGKGWIFDASGNFYYNGVAPNPKILFEPNGAITSLNSITAPTITASTSINSDLITAINGTATKNSIMMDNQFFNATNGSIDLKAHYVGFPYITQVLDLTSKYMAIKPLSTGNFQMEINNITKKLMVSDWATTSIKTDFVWKWMNSAGYSFVEIDGNSGVPFEVHTDFLHSGPALRFNTGGTLGLYVSSLSVYRWTIDILGAAVFSSLNASSGTIQTTGTISGGAISCSSLNASAGTIQTTGSISGGAISCSSLNASSGTIQTTGAVNGATITASTSFNSDLIVATTGTATKNSIMMDNQFIDGTNGSIDLKAHFVGFPYLTQSLDLTSKYMFIKPLSDGNFEIQINNIASKVFSSNWSTLTLTSAFNLALGSKTITTTGAVSTGDITCPTMTSATTKATLFEAVLLNTYRNKIQMSNLFFSTSIASMDLVAQYVGFPHPLQNLDIYSKYMAIIPQTDGNVGFAINNISGYILYTDWGTRRAICEYTFVFKTSPFSSGYRYQSFYNNVTEIGSVTMLTGSTIAFNTSSDYRLKQDVIPIQNPLERLMKLKPKNYRFIADVESESCCECYFDGFIAHEVQEILPMIVTGKKDDPNQMQQMDYSKLTPICVGAIQELNEKVDKMHLIIDTQQKMIDSQQKMIEMLMSRLDNFYKDNSSLATSDNVISGGSTGVGTVETSVGTVETSVGTSVETCVETCVETSGTIN